VLDSTEEERRLLDCMTPEWWAAHPSAQLRDVSILEATMTRSGVEATLKVSGSMNREKLEGLTELLRVFFNVKDEHPLVVLPGGRATLAKLAIRTRRITEEMDMLWHPDRVGIGVDSVSGAVVDIPLLSQIQVAGAKGSGKSWAFRPLMASAAIDPTFEMMFMDPKVVEGARWKGIVPTFYPGEFDDALDDVVTDMFRRRDLMQRESATVWRPEFGPYRIVVVDEGREMLSELKLTERMRGKRSRGQNFEEALEDDDGGGGLLKLIRISSMGRAWGVFLWWATQYPMVSGSNPGVDTNIDANTDYRFSLRVGKRKHAEVSLGDDADYGPHLLTAEDRNRGTGFLGGYGPSLIQTWTVTDQMVDLLARPNHGRGFYPRDVALATLHRQPGAVWNAELFASQTGSGVNQATRFLWSFAHEGLMTRDGDAFRLAV
jgi:hypothetical protein